MATPVLTSKRSGPFSRLRRGLTLGAQGVVIGPNDTVLMVRHSYRPGWFFPGGGVEWGEPVETALARELEEEVGVKLTGPVELHGVFANFASFPGDHILVFVVRHWEQHRFQRRDNEIAEIGCFDRHSLPETADAGSRRRLAEIFDGAARTPLW